MPRKAAAATEGEPRRSSRIKEQPKPLPPAKKAPAKRGPKKAAAKPKGAQEEEESAGEAKANSPRGKKRTTAEANGEDAVPPAKKVC
jgi:hypothetical protein